MKSKGFGDTVHKAAKLIGADKVAKTYLDRDWETIHLNCEFY